MTRMIPRQALGCIAEAVFRSLGVSQNKATGQGASVSAGAPNEAAGSSSSCAGGWHNHADGEYSVVSDGLNRQAPGDYSWRAGDLLQGAVVPPDRQGSYASCMRFLPPWRLLLIRRHDLCAVDVDHACYWL